MSSYYDISYLEQSVAQTGCQLCLMANKLHEVEQNLNVENVGEVDEIYVMKLLESMTEVNNEYQNLRKDLQEVQQLQRDVTSSLRCQMRDLTHTFKSLKLRIELNAAAAAATFEDGEVSGRRSGNSAPNAPPFPPARH